MSAAPRAGNDAGLIAMCGAMVVAAGAAAALPAGQGAASALLGGGWVWPAQSGLFPAIGGLLTGEPGRGLDPADLPALASAPAIYSAIAVLEALLLLAMVLAAVMALRMRGHRGLATRVQAQLEFGPGALRKRRAQIRPDLYGKGQGATR